MRPDVVTDAIEQAIVQQRWFNYVRVGFDARPLEFLPGGRIHRGGGLCERTWALAERAGVLQLVIGGHAFSTCELVADGSGGWRGSWLEYERMPVRLEPLIVDSELTRRFPTESGPAEHFLKIQGLQRSGTNYLQWLLEFNFARMRVLNNETGWKHAPIADEIDWSGADWVDPDIDRQLKHRRIVDQLAELGPDLAALQRSVHARRLRYLVICKNPYSWYASYSRYRGAPPSPLRRKWIRLWVEMNGHWLAFCDSHPGQARLLRYEDLLGGSEVVLTRELQTFGVSRNEGSWRQPDGRLDAGCKTVDAFDDGYYLGHEYLNQYTDTDLRCFARELPRSLMRRLRYPVLRSLPGNRRTPSRAHVIASHAATGISTHRRRNPGEEDIQ